MNRDGAGLLGRYAQGREGCRYVSISCLIPSWKTKIAIRVLHAGLAGKNGQLLIQILLVLAIRQTQGLRLVHGIIEYGRGGQVQEVVGAVGHAGARAQMHTTCEGTDKIK